MLKIAWSEIYAHPLPKNHRFPMEKYNLLPEQLLFEGTVTHDNFFAPQPLSDHQVTRTHDAHYWQKLKDQSLTRQQERRTGFPLSKELVAREIVIMNGTVQCALFAIEYGVAINIAGGTHHAFTDRGEGFCLLNDIAIATHHLLDNGLAKKVLVVDLDVHQGNGTAQIFEQNDNVFTFSMHGQSNYPMHKETSDLDVGLLDGTDDTTYLNLLDRHLNEVFDSFQPDFVCFQSGVDILATDKLGRLGVTINGCKARDGMVLNLCHRHNVPVMACMGGGYSEKIAHIIEAHANTYRLAQEIYF